jgi:hypothetical protein
MNRFWDETEYEQEPINPNVNNFKPNTNFYEKEDKGESIPF